MYKIEAPYIDQSVKYPTGCESVSAVMLLRYLGYDIEVETFVNQFLDKKDFAYRDGVLYGPNPYQYFVGSPYDENAMGCYAPVIVRALKRVVGKEYQVLNETGKTVRELVHTYIKNDMPVILWACINMREPVTGPSWKLFENGETFTWISNEHCMLLVGYDDSNYYVNDPYENQGVTAYNKTILEERHQAQHMQAVGIKRL